MAKVSLTFTRIRGQNPTCSIGPGSRGEKPFWASVGASKHCRWRGGVPLLGTRSGRAASVPPVGGGKGILILRSLVGRKKSQNKRRRRMNPQKGWGGHKGEKNGEEGKQNPQKMPWQKLSRGFPGAVTGSFGHYPQGVTEGQKGTFPGVTPKVQGGWWAGG